MARRKREERLGEPEMLPEEMVRRCAVPEGVTHLTCPRCDRVLPLDSFRSGLPVKWNPFGFSTRCHGCRLVHSERGGYLLLP